MNPLPPSPSPEAIALRAYTLWEQAGRPVGLDTAHWQQAEAELRREQDLKSESAVAITAALAAPAETATAGNRSVATAFKVPRSRSGVGTTSTA